MSDAAVGELEASLRRDLYSYDHDIEQDQGKGTGACAGDKRIRLFGVGSCYNPFVQSTGPSDLEVTAVDLYPAHESVLQRDFLDLHIAPAGSEAVCRIVNKAEAATAIASDSDVTTATSSSRCGGGLEGGAELVANN